MRRFLAPARLIVVPLAAAALAAGCGGDSGEASATEWANDVCSAITTWTGSIASTTETLSGNLSEDALRDAADDLESDTNAFVEDLRKLGPPDTEAGDEAQQSLDELADALDDSTATISGAVDEAAGANGVLEAVSTVSTALSALADQVAKAFTELEALDVAGELEKAFEDADSCDELAS